MTQRRQKGGESTGGSIRAAGRTRVERAQDRAHDARVRALAPRLLSFVHYVAERGEEELSDVSMGPISRDLMMAFVEDAKRLLSRVKGDSR